MVGRTGRNLMTGCLVAAVGIMGYCAGNQTISRVNEVHEQARTASQATAIRDYLLSQPALSLLTFQHRQLEAHIALNSAQDLLIFYNFPYKESSGWRGGKVMIDESPLGTVDYEGFFITKSATSYEPLQTSATMRSSNNQQLTKEEFKEAIDEAYNSLFSQINPGAVQWQNFINASLPKES